MSELPENWRDDLPDDMKSNGVLDTVKSFENLAKMAIDGRTLATTAIRIPSGEADDETQKAFRVDLMQKLPDLMFKPDINNAEQLSETMKHLGCPDQATDYELDGLPDGIKDNMINLSEKAHAAGLTTNQFKSVTNAIVDDYKTNSDVAYAKIEEDRNALKSEWGAAYDQKVKTVSHFAKQTGFSDDFVSAISDGLIDSTNMKAFNTVIEGYQGGAVEIGNQANNPAVIMTPAEAEAQLNELMGNKDHAYWHSENPAHQSAVDKVVELGKLAETGEMSESEKFRHSLLGG